MLRMMGCAGYGGEVINSDFYGKRSKFERRNIKKHRGDGPRCFFVGMECGGGLAFQDFEGGAGGGAEHVDAGSQTFERFCGLDSGAERDAVN